MNDALLKIYRCTRVLQYQLIVTGAHQSFFIPHSFRKKLSRRTVLDYFTQYAAKWISCRQTSLRPYFTINLHHKLFSKLFSTFLSRCRLPLYCAVLQSIKFLEQSCGYNIITFIDLISHNASLVPTIKMCSWRSSIPDHQPHQLRRITVREKLLNVFDHFTLTTVKQNFLAMLLFVGLYHCRVMQMKRFACTDCSSILCEALLYSKP